MTTPAKKDDRIYRYGDYITWPDHERWELIDGVAHNMSPAPNNEHQRLVGEFFAEIRNFLRETKSSCQVRVAPFDVRLPEAGEEDTFIKNIVQPDIVVTCDPSKLDRAGLRGAPDLVVEVLSPSTAKKDQTKKKDLYERFGVKEYWLVHPTDSLVYVYLLEPAENLPDAGARYGHPKILGYEDRLESRVLSGFGLDLSEVLAEVGA